MLEVDNLGRALMLTRYERNSRILEHAVMVHCLTVEERDVLRKTEEVKSQITARLLSLDLFFPPRLRS